MKKLLTPEESLLLFLTQEARPPAVKPRGPATIGQAAARVRARICADAELFPGDEEVASLLGYLAEHLFDSDLDVNRWLAAAGGSRAARDRFTAKKGPLKAYLDAHRVAVAAEVLRREPASRGGIGKVRRQVGIRDPRTFQRTFERVFGTSPSEFRAAARERAGSDTAPADPGESGFATEPDAFEADASAPDENTRRLATRWRRQVTLGLLDHQRTDELRHRLRQWYPPLRQVPWKRGFAGYCRYSFPILTGRDLELRDAAFRVIDAIIENDGQAAPELEKLLQAIHGLVFQPRLTLERVLRIAGFPERSILARFEEHTGQTPWSYLREARLETAARLLLWTSLEVAAVARLVGFQSRTAFHRSFRDFAGRAPRDYRREARSLLERAGPPPGGSETASYWEDVVSGRLSVGEASMLDLYLEVLT